MSPDRWVLIGDTEGDLDVSEIKDGKEDKGRPELHGFVGRQRAHPDQWWAVLLMRGHTIVLRDGFATEADAKKVVSDKITNIVNGLPAL